MVYTVKCIWDEEAKVWVADSDDIPGLVLESGPLDALMERVKIAASELVELNKLPQNSIIHYVSEKNSKDVCVMAEYEKKVREILKVNGCTFVRRGK